MGAIAEELDSTIGYEGMADITQIAEGWLSIRRMAEKAGGGIFSVLPCVVPRSDKQGRREGGRFWIVVITPARLALSGYPDDVSVLAAGADELQASRVALRLDDLLPHHSSSNSMTGCMVHLQFIKSPGLPRTKGFSWMTGGFESDCTVPSSARCRSRGC